MPAAALAASEVVQWWASRRLASPGRAEVVLVLGYHNPGEAINAVNRWRIGAGVRTWAAAAPGARLVLSGGSRDGGVSEAGLLAAYAQQAYAIPRDRLVLEERALSTWENIAYAIPLLESPRGIAIVSQPLHALKARRYLWAQRPDLGARLVRARDYRLGQFGWRGPGVAAYGVLDLIQSRATARAIEKRATARRRPAT